MELERPTYTNWCNNSCLTRGPGRPRNSPISSIRTLFWARQVCIRANRYTGYSLERYFRGTPFKKNDDDETIRTCKWDKYLNGKRNPGNKTVEVVNQMLPGTARYYHHPIWYFCNPDDLCIDEIYKQFSLLRPGISGYLVSTGHHESNHIHRIKRSFIDEPDFLDKQGDFDALAACIGIARERDKCEHPILAEPYIRVAFRIFMRITWLTSYNHIAYDFFSYMKEFFFSKSQDNKLNKVLLNFSLFNEYQYNYTLFTILSDIGLPSYSVAEISSLLRISYRYINPSTFIEMVEHHENGDFISIRKIRKIRNLCRCYLRWRKQWLSTRSTFNTPN